jgi:hypothetical protein
VPEGYLRILNVKTLSERQRLKRWVPQKVMEHDSGSEVRRRVTLKQVRSKKDKTSPALQAYGPEEDYPGQRCQTSLAELYKRRRASPGRFRTTIDHVITGSGASGATISSAGASILAPNKPLPIPLARSASNAPVASRARSSHDARRQPRVEARQAAAHKCGSGPDGPGSSQL